MQPSSEFYVPVANVVTAIVDQTTVLTIADGDEGCTLTETGEEVWSLLQQRSRTVDRLVMALARRSSGQALALVPDRVREELDRFISHGLVRRVAA